MNQVDARLPWADISPRWGHPWHVMCSYLGSFPAPLARTFISMLSDEGGVVLDPFCGRGTTLLEARLSGRTPLASDSNPIAIALTRAKNVSLSVGTVLARIDELERVFDASLYLPEAQVQPDDVSLIYHPHTLAKLCYLRRRLVPATSPEDEFLIGVTLGIMHGGERQDGSSSYASISMPNTFSMSPGYVRRFVQTNRLRRVDRDVFELLRNKVRSLFRQDTSFLSSGLVCRADAKGLSSVAEFARFTGRVDLILTSPPYLDVVNYARQNWIRMWFLGEDPKEASETLDDNLTLGPWLDFAERTVIEMKRMLGPHGVIVLVVGDVARASNTIVSPARELIRLLHHKGLFSYIGCLNDRLPIEDKTTRIWKETKGRATAIDRILILSDETPNFRPVSLQDAKLDQEPPRNGVTHEESDLSATDLLEYAHSFAGLK
jgi:DNA methylase